jgi:hypothetical protein
MCAQSESQLETQSGSVAVRRSVSFTGAVKNREPKRYASAPRFMLNRPRNVPNRSIHHKSLYRNVSNRSIHHISPNHRTVPVLGP